LSRVLTPSARASSGRRHSEPERFGGREVDEQKEVGRQSAYAGIDLIISSCSGIA